MFVKSHSHTKFISTTLKAFSNTRSHQSHFHKSVLHQNQFHQPFHSRHYITNVNWSKIVESGNNNDIKLALELNSPIEFVDPISGENILHSLAKHRHTLKPETWKMFQSKLNVGQTNIHRLLQMKNKIGQTPVEIALEQYTIWALASAPHEKFVDFVISDFFGGGVSKERSKMFEDVSLVYFMSLHPLLLRELGVSTNYGATPIEQIILTKCNLTPISLLASRELVLFRGWSVQKVYNSFEVGANQSMEDLKLSDANFIQCFKNKSVLNELLRRTGDMGIVAIAGLMLSYSNNKVAEEYVYCMNGGAQNIFFESMKISDNAKIGIWRIAKMIAPLVLKKFDVSEEYGKTFYRNLVCKLNPMFVVWFMQTLGIEDDDEPAVVKQRLNRAKRFLSNTDQNGLTILDHCIDRNWLERLYLLSIFSFPFFRQGRIDLVEELLNREDRSGKTLISKIPVSTRLFLKLGMNVLSGNINVKKILVVAGVSLAIAILFVFTFALIALFKLIKLLFVYATK